MNTTAKTRVVRTAARDKISTPTSWRFVYTAYSKLPGLGFTTPPR
jgi:hypothetical protein